MPCIECGDIIICLGNILLNIFLDVVYKRSVFLNGRLQCRKLIFLFLNELFCGIDLSLPFLTLIIQFRNLLLRCFNGISIFLPPHFGSDIHALFTEIFGIPQQSLDNITRQFFAAEIFIGTIDYTIRPLFGFFVRTGQLSPYAFIQITRVDVLDEVFECVQRCVREFSLLTDFLRIFGVISPCKGFFQNDILDDFADTLCMRTGYGKIKAALIQNLTICQITTFIGNIIQNNKVTGTDIVHAQAFHSRLQNIFVSCNLQIALLAKNSMQSSNASIENIKDIIIGISERHTFLQIFNNIFFAFRLCTEYLDDFFVNGSKAAKNLSAIVDVWLIVPCHNSNIAGLDIRFFSDSEARETLPVFVFVRQVIVCFKRNEFAIFQVSKASPRPTKAVVSCTHAQRNNIFILLQNASRSLKILPEIHRHILIFSLPLFPSLSYRN